MSCLFRKTKENSAEPEIRWAEVNAATDEAQLDTPGEDVNEQYEGVLKRLRENSKLTDREKAQAVENFTFMKDRENLIRLRVPKYPCKKCGGIALTISFCNLCACKRLQDDFKNWTSGNKIIDEAIQQSQTDLPLPRYIIEWIPYHNLEDIQYLTSGGFAEISTAVWKKGVILSFDQAKCEFKRSKPGVVVLKKLLKSQSEDENFLKELKAHLLLGSKGYTVATCYGITRDPSTKEYVLVLAHYEQDLSRYIKDCYGKITWKDIYNIFYNVSEDLYNIHKENLVHCDLHSKNVLKSRGNLFHLSDFGLCCPPNKKSTDIYGNLPFIAPEVLTTGKYTPAADIYSMGMLMYHATACHPPFAGRVHNAQLSCDIVNGIRPPIPNGLPPSYEALMKECWKPNPLDRPTAEDLYYYFLDEYSAIHDSGKESGLVQESVTTRIQQTLDIRGQSDTLVENSYLFTGSILETRSNNLISTSQSDTLVMDFGYVQSSIYSFDEQEAHDSKICNIPKSNVDVVWKKPAKNPNRKKSNLIKKGHLVLLNPREKPGSASLASK